MKSSVLFLTAAMILSVYSTSVHGQTAKIRIGVFDSRAVGVAWFNSPFSDAREIANALNTRMKDAKEKNDSVAIAKIEREGKLRQAMGHEIAFGTGSIRYVIESIKDKLSSLAKENNLSLIVSKWELNTFADDVEIIDITDKIADLFNPDEKVKGWLKEFRNVEPVKDAYLAED